jgi:hypothetical protein
VSKRIVATTSYNYALSSIAVLVFLHVSNDLVKNPELSNKEDGIRLPHNQNRKPHLISRVWCSGNIVDSQSSGLTTPSTAPGSTPGIRVTYIFCLFIPLL